MFIFHFELTETSLRMPYFGRENNSPRYWIQKIFDSGHRREIQRQNACQDELIYWRHSCPGAVSGSCINVITAVARWYWTSADQSASQATPSFVYNGVYGELRQKRTSWIKAGRNWGLGVSMDSIQIWSDVDSNSAIYLIQISWAISY